MMFKKRSFRPDWTESPPLPGSYRSIFKLGKQNEFKHPSDAWYEMIKEEFGMSDDDFKQKQKEGNEKVELGEKPRLDSTQMETLKGIVGEKNVSLDDYSRVKFSSGQMLEEVTSLRNNTIHNIADIVLHPKHKGDVEQIVRYCSEQHISIYAYGGGSSAVQGVKPVRGGVSLVLSTHMNRLLKINEINQTATVQPGLMGPEFEKALNGAPERHDCKVRYTCGHFPQSFEISSVGGWISALGSGQASTYYGDAYGMVLSQEYVTPVGSLKTLEYPATASGPKVNDIMKGSEGSFGILVELTVKIFRYMPDNRQRFAFMFPSWEAAVTASREIMQGEFGLPAVYRISDPEETERGLKLFGGHGGPFQALITRRGFKPMERCLALGTVEGEKGFTRHVKRQIKRICREQGAMYLTGIPTKMWEKTRYKEPLMREDWMDYGIIGDTLEASVTWDNLRALHQGVRSYIKKRPGTICMTHASHFYANGTNLYFIFILRPNSWEEYKRFYEGIINEMLKHGGSVSHHHGVGKLFAPWMEAHLGKEQMSVLRALKAHFDPNNIMNPGGQLGLDLPDDQKREIQ